MTSYRWAALTASLLLVCLTSLHSVSAAPTRGTPAIGVASPVDAARLLRTSMSTMKRQLHSVHASGMLQNGACCPRAAAQARLSGDCVLSSSSFALRMAQRGTTVDRGTTGHGKRVVTVDSRFITKSSASKPGPWAWERSPATHNLWQVDSTPTKDTDIAFFVCPMVAMGQFTRHFPAHLVNLGAVSVHGVPAWHLRDRLAMTSGAFKGTTYQTDFYLARASSYWIRFSYLYDDGSSSQHAVEDYSGFNMPVRIAAPTVGSSTP